MPNRNKITTKGFFTEKLGDGYDELVVDGVQQTLPTMFKVSSGSVSVAVTDPVTFVPMGVTATLPRITNASVGRIYVLSLTASNLALAPSNPNGQVLLSSSNQQLINGSGQHRNLSGSCNVVWCFATKTPANTFTWICASGSST